MNWHPTIAGASHFLGVVTAGILVVGCLLNGLFYLLFPELGALAHDVMKHPWGKWASQPLRLMFTPVLTAIVGTLISRHLPYHVLTILLVVGACLAIIFLLRSAIAPAISAGVLPLALGVKSWLYPLSILGGITALVVLLIAWRKFHRIWRLYPALSVAAGTAVLTVLFLLWRRMFLTAQLARRVSSGEDVLGSDTVGAPSVG